ncbi:hypothetical protein VHEMI06067 [[Torrubiella] hemipterigena]|uniref:AB hydrolase-1 domain-containing protein n=1 Tax=[Torrubiella] hemipterigena TaxID=1531966 RepID=A0A0A1TIK4_9HYPO|nr:hypothetical protein VHEMI06067 [[Torrubiella] hemipterigena]
MPSIQTSLGDVVYTTQGDGPPVVLLHATLHDSRDFASIVDKLATRYKVLALDWPWHGESKGLPSLDGLTAEALADVLEEVMSRLQLGSALFIGNSVGGFAAARLAIRKPELVRGLVLVNNGGFLEWSATSRLFCKALGTPGLARWILPAMVPRYMAAESDLDQEISKRAIARAKTVQGSQVAASLWRSFPAKGHDLRGQGDQIKVPTLIIWGTRDGTLPAGSDDLAKQNIPGSRLERIEAGHVVFASKPNEFLALVEPFFASIPL